MSAALARAPVPLALMALIFFLSAQSDPGPELPAAFRIAAHFGEYLALTIALAWALAPALERPVAAAAAIAFLYALSDEWHQSFVPGRDADALDVVVDALGIAAAGWVLSRRFVARSRTG